jgi:hypothetical protein
MNIISGYITEEELFSAMNQFRSVSKEDIHKMVRAVDTDGNGKISISGKEKLDFFVLIFNKILFQYFRIYKNDGNCLI